MKKIYTLFVLMLMPLMAFANDVLIGDLYYNLNVTDKTAEVTRYKAGFTGALEIPEKTTYDGTDYTVTSIGYSAFHHCYDISSLTLPNSIISIGEAAFWNCNGLTSLVIPEGVKTIGNNAFEACNRLEMIELPSTLTQIGEKAFCDCTSLIQIVSHLENPFAINEKTFGKIAYIDGAETIVCSQVFLRVPDGTTDKYRSTSGWSEFIMIVEGEMKQTTIDGMSYTYFTGSKNASLTHGELPMFTPTDLTIPSSINIDGVDYALWAIGDLAIRNRPELRSLAISEGIRMIGDKAFEACYRLKSVDLPSTLLYIGNDAFRDCTLLSYTIARMVHPFRMGDYVFGSVKWNGNEGRVAPPTTKLVVPDGTKSDYLSTASWKTFPIILEGELKEYTLDGMTYAYIENSNNATLFDAELTAADIVIPSKVTIGNKDYSVIGIDAAAFKEESNLTSVVIPEGIKTIGHSAFLSCNNLRKVELPSTLTEIAYEAFCSCGSLAFVVSHIDDPFEIYVNVFGTSGWVGDVRPNIPATATLCVPSGTKSKYQSTSSWKDFTNIVETDLKETVIDGLIYYCLTSLNEATVVGGKSTESDLLIPASIETDGIVFHVTKIANNAFLNNKVVETISIAESVKTIGYSAFGYCSNLKRLELPSTLTSIGEFVIGGNSKLESVTSYMTDPINVGENTFKYNQNTPSSATLYVPIGTKSKYEAISGWIQFANLEEGEAKQAKVGDLVYLYSTGSKTATVIQDAGYKELKSVIIPASITVEGVDYKVIAVGESAFERCWDIKSVTINADLETIGNSAFWNVMISELSLPSSLRSIGSNAFNACNQLTSLVIPEGVESIGKNAFSDCYRLQYLDLPSTLTSIGDYVISNSAALSVVISRMTDPINVGENTFVNSTWDNSTHTYVYTPASATLYVPVGSKSQYEAIPGWTQFAKIEEGEIKEAVVGDLKYRYSTGSKTATVIQDESYKELKSITIPTSITVEGVDYKVIVVGESAFESCRKIQSITINANIETIGNYAFNSVAMQELILPNSLRSIGGLAFGACNQLTSLVIPEGVESIGNDAFRGCSRLRYLELPSTLTSIGDYVISNTDALSVVVSRMKDPINVGENAFTNNTWDNSTQTVVYTPSSATLYVPEGSKSKYEAISGWTKFAKIEEGELKEVDGLSYRLSTGSKTATVVSGDYYSLVSATIPASVTIDGVDYEVTAIGDGAFEKGRILVHLELPSTLVSIGENAFSSRLKAVVSNMTTPIQLGKQNYMSGATLYVPKGSVNLYEASDSWNIFKKIKAIEPYVEPSTILETPLTFEAVEGTVKVSFFNRWASASFPIKYRIDDGPWLYGIIREDGTWATSHFVGKKLQFIAEFMTNTYSKYVQVSCDNDCYIYGNILSMTNGDDFATISESGTCGRLFSGNTHIKNHPTKGLVLPATSLSNGCYMGLFSGCTSLTAAPELPATILSNRCYQEMFKGCSNINEIVCKAVDVSAENCTTSWLDGVSATGTFYKDASMTDWTEGVDGIPTGWTVKDFNTKVEKGDVVYTPHDEDHTVTVSDGGESSSEIVIQSSISINGVSYDVTAIGDCAFQNNELVVKVTIPETIASIGLKAFAGCINLKSIFIYVKVPINLSGVSASRTRVDGGSTVFSGVDTETCVLYVPAGSGEAYRNADVWKDFKNIVEIPVSASINVAKGMTTYTSEYNLDFSGFGDEVKAYVATGYDYDSQTIWLTRVKDVPAGTPILVKALASETPYDVPVKESSGCYYKNMFVANTTDGAIYPPETSGEMTNYYLSSGIFKTATGTNAINPGKCYLQIPTVAPTPVVGGSQYVKLNDYGFASFCGSQDLDFTDVEGLKAFAATGYDDAVGTIWLTRVKRVSAGTGLLLMGAANVEYTIPSTAVKSYYANMMVGNTSSETITIYTTSGDMTNYYLSGNKLLKAAAAGTAGNTIKPGKAYMQIPSAHVTRSIVDDPTEDLSVYDLLNKPEVISMQVMTRGMGGDDDTTGIREAIQPEQTNDVYYNLNGQRVENPGKGLYIHNGKKVVIK